MFTLPTVDQMWGQSTCMSSWRASRSLAWRSACSSGGMACPTAGIFASSAWHSTAQSHGLDTNEPVVSVVTGPKCARQCAGRLLLAPPRHPAQLSCRAALAMQRAQ